MPTAKNAKKTPICNRVSEQPSESCSVLDESENILRAGEEDLVESTSRMSSESKLSDKENSNIRSNKSKDKNTVTTTNINTNSINTPSKSATLRDKNKGGLSAQSIRNIRIAPSFKGMSTVLTTATTNSKT